MSLNLSPRRRTELIELLEDEERLVATWPQLAEYLETAPSLRGTGDRSLDADFDLRMAHYLTVDPSSVENPYWNILLPVVNASRDRSVIDGGLSNGSPRLAFAQTVLQEVFAYAIPSPSALSWIRDVSRGRQVVEVGAGRGYWAKLLSQCGQSVVAYDKNSGTYWHEVHEMSELSLSDNEASVLLLCWPPGWENKMASQTLKWFEATGGQRLIYIGEPEGGMTGDSEFHAALRRGWKISSRGRHVRWWNVNDEATHWTRS